MSLEKLQDENWLKSFQIVDWGITQQNSPQSWQQYQNWIKNDRHGPLGYMADHRAETRSDYKKLFPAYQSALIFLFDYTPAKATYKNSNIASYVLGFEDMDYHYWIENKLFHIMTEIMPDLSDQNYFLCIDSRPILERDLAYSAGLGWIGKNSMLINRKHGSYQIIASVLLDHIPKLAMKAVEVDHCGNCTACIEACPTQAIIPNERTVDANKCISTFTIELFKDADAPKGYQTTKEIYGCDICQDVCPWNRKPLETATVLSKMNSKIDQFFSRSKEQIISELLQMSNRSFRKFFHLTPLARTGREGLIKNFKRKV